MMTLPSPEELQRAWLELCQIHAQYLKPHGVHLPKANQYNDTGRSIHLAVLYYFKSQKIHKDVISRVCQRDKPSLGADQQVRHLKRFGWHLTGTKGYHCLNPYQPSSEWQSDKKRRDGRLNAKTFNDLKLIYGMCCATCGAKEGESNPRYGDDPVVLQQGHKDPEKPASDMNNIIPQCQFCNRAYRRNFVFDDKGRVRAIADIEPVRLASESVQRKVLDWLTKKFS